jgi:hypothetical protein
MTRADLDAALPFWVGCIVFGVILAILWVVNG